MAIRDSFLSALSDAEAAYFPFFLVEGAPLRCAKSEAATSFSFLVLFGLLRILPASDAAFFPVAISSTPCAGGATIGA